MIKIEILQIESVHVDQFIKPEPPLGKGIIMTTTLFFPVHLL